MLHLLVICYVLGTLYILSYLTYRFPVFHIMRGDNFCLAALMKSCLHKASITCWQPSMIVHLLAHLLCYTVSCLKVRTMTCFHCGIQEFFRLSVTK